MSGIYIPGMEMPTSCDFCIFDNGVNCMVYPPSEDMVYDIADGTPDWCPLVPVPEHGRLIDADALIGKLHDECLFDYDARSVVYADIQDAPTIIMADPAYKEGEG